MSSTVLASPVDVRRVTSADVDVVSVESSLMGGRVGIHLRPVRSPDSASTTLRDDRRAERDATRAIRRIASWADRLTRFAATSELSRLNADPRPAVAVGPTLAAVLGQGHEAGRRSGGIVDPTLLDARIAAEDPAAGRPDRAARAAADTIEWRIRPARRGALVERRPGVRFDLGGIAKGWIADRASAGLAGYRAVVVDADGDIAIALGHGESWRIGVADPRPETTDLAVLELTGLDPAGPARFGLATSGTSVHRWTHDGRPSHHLIDPRTGRPAVTDVVQATVLADSATTAEAAAKSIVILGSQEGIVVMEDPAVSAVIVLTEDGEVLASPSTLRWLA